MYAGGQTCATCTCCPGARRRPAGGAHARVLTRLAHLHTRRYRLRMRKRVTFSLGGPTTARVRRCGARHPGGASEYIEKLVRDDELREAGRTMTAWYATHPSYVDDALAETAAALDEAS